MNKEVEETIRITLELLPLPIIIHDFDHIYYFNGQAKQILSLLSKTDAQKSFFSVYDFLHPHYYSLVRERQAEFPTMMVGQIYEHELKIVSQENILTDMSLFSTPIRYYGEKMLLTAARDVTKERRYTEEILQRAEKLMMVGQMAAGIAHEIRNPLTAIKGFVQLLSEKHEEDQVYYQLMLNELDRVNMIVSDFLLLAKPEILQFRKIDLLPLLHEVKALLEPQSKLSNVEIDVVAEGPIMFVRGDKNQIKQVMIIW